jgi:hypothetical protein
MATYRRDRETYRYAQSRAKAFATAEALYESASSSAFSLRGIDSHALFAWRTRWPAHQGLDRDMGRWDWEMLAASYHRRPSAFHLAIWSGNELCGLAVGRPSRSRRRLTVEYMEGSPNPIPWLRACTRGPSRAILRKEDFLMAKSKLAKKSAKESKPARKKRTVLRAPTEAEVTERLSKGLGWIASLTPEQKEILRSMEGPIFLGRPGKPRRYG